MRPGSPVLSVIIPHLNQPAELEQCLASLDSQLLDQPAFEIIVVDNGSAEPPAAVVAAHPRARLLHEPSPGPGLARNRGVEAAVGTILCFIDADCRAHRDWLRSAVRALESSPSGSILGGDVQIWRQDPSTFTALEAYESVFSYQFKFYIERQGFCGTGNLVVRRADFARVGPFAGIHVAEDNDWGKRAGAAGFAFHYIPEMIVFHPARASMREIFVKWDRHIQHHLNMARSERAWVVRWLARALAVLASPAIDAAQVFASDRIRGVQTRMKAVAVLAVIRAYRAWRMVALLISNKGILWNRDVAVDDRGRPEVA